MKESEELMMSSYLKANSMEMALNTCKDNLLNKQVTLSHPHFLAGRLLAGPVQSLVSLNCSILYSRSHSSLKVCR